MHGFQQKWDGDGHQLPVAEVGNDRENPFAARNRLPVMFQPFHIDPFMEVSRCDGRQAEEFRYRDGFAAVDSLGDRHQLFHLLFRKGTPQVVQSDQPMLQGYVVEKPEQGFEEEFPDTERDALSASQKDACRSGLLHGHKCLCFCLTGGCSAVKNSEGAHPSARGRRSGQNPERSIGTGAYILFGLG